MFDASGLEITPGYDYDDYYYYDSKNLLVQRNDIEVVA